MEAAFLIAVADDFLSANEIELLTASMTFLRGIPIGPAELEAELERLNEARSHEGVDLRIAHIAEALETAEERAITLQFASVIAVCDRWMVPREHGTLFKLGRALGFTPEEILRSIEETRRMSQD